MISTRTVRPLALFIALQASSACRVQRDDTSDIKTDLGAAGNQAVLKNHNAYMAKSDAGCVVAADATNFKRVIVTGFGLFDDAPYNISGVVVQSMADTNYWSGKVKDNVSSPSTSPNAAPASGKISASDFGGRAKTRVVTVDDKSYEVCFLVLDVKWDLAGSIIVSEMQRFKPDMVIMSGRGGDANGTATLEAAAINKAVKSAGYSAAGHAALKNIPAVDGEQILADKAPVNGNPDTIAMTWDNVALAKAAEAPLAAASFKIEAAVAADMSNDYICNNVSYVALYGAKGDSLKLAGEDLEMKIEGGLPNAKIGFFHLPYNATNETPSVNALINAYAAIINAQLK